MMLRKNNAIMAARVLGMAKMLELQQWDHMSPLRQFYCLPFEVISKIEERDLTVLRLREMSVPEIGLYLLICLHKITVITIKLLQLSSD